MRPIFTIHAGEFLFGEALKKEAPLCELWLPIKDTGIDFLVTGDHLEKPIGVQVKMSRDYSPPVARTDFERQQSCGGWLTINLGKLAASQASIWSIVVVSNERKRKPHFINVPKNVLYEKVSAAVSGEASKSKSVHFYPSVLRSKPRGKGDSICINTRGMTKSEKNNVANDWSNIEAKRDLSPFFDNWSFFQP